MSKGGNSPGASKLAGSIRTIAGLDKDGALTLDLGEIQPGGSLFTDSYPVAIPKGDYLVCSGYALGSGRRVLVAWVGSDAVVVDAVAEAEDHL